MKVFQNFKRDFLPKLAEEISGAYFLGEFLIRSHFELAKTCKCKKLVVNNKYFALEQFNYHFLLE